MATARETVYEARRYGVLNVNEAKTIASRILSRWGFADGAVGFGLPEVDDRYHVWRVPTLAPSGERVGEIVIDAKTSLIHEQRTSSPDAIKERLALAIGTKSPAQPLRPKRTIARSELRNTILLGDSEETLADLPAESIDLVFTSPPYFNARPDYTEYAEYEAYLSKMRRVIQQCHRLLNDGRFFAINCAPVLLRRANRNQASRRIAVPFDLHRVFVEEGFDFIDDIIWEKPEGAGWATGRGRRFAADRNPLQYKAVPVTEYVLVFRKHTDRLIDWNIRNHHDQEAVKRSRVVDGYERTNIWRITPTSTADHPAVFPIELADRVVRYYSFEGDVVLDPFAGSGTTGAAASRLKRRFVLAENEPDYVDVMRNKTGEWLGVEASEVLCINCPPVPAPNRLL